MKQLFKIQMNLGEGLAEAFSFTPIQFVLELLAAGASLSNVTICKA